MTEEMQSSKRISSEIDTSIGSRDMDIQSVAFKVYLLDVEWQPKIPETQWPQFSPENSARHGYTGWAAKK